VEWSTVNGRLILQPILLQVFTPNSEVGGDGALRRPRAVQARNRGYTQPDLHNSFRPLNEVGDSAARCPYHQLAKRYLGVRVYFERGEEGCLEKVGYGF
jgi:hypothetical protein